MSENPRQDLREVLQTRFTALTNAYQRLDAEADQQIVNWRYAEEAVFEPRVDGLRRSGFEIGKLVDEEPTHAYSFFAYGYDTQERIIYSASFQMESDPRQCIFYTYLPDGIELAEFGAELYSTKYQLRRVGRLVQLPGQLPQYYAEHTTQEGRAVHLFEEYHYDERGRLARILSKFESEPRPFSQQAQKGWEHGIDQQRRMARMLGTEDQFEKMFPQFEQIVEGMLNHRVNIESEEVYHYEGDTLQRIVAHSIDTHSDANTNRRERIVYEAPQPGENEENLFEAARASLRAAVLSHLKAYNPVKRQQVIYYSLVLSYDAVADEGISLQLCEEAQRQAWENQTEDHTYLSLMMHQSTWKLPAFGHPYEELITISDLPRDYERLLTAYRREKRWGDVRKLLVQIARDLNTQDWNGILLTTEDFIVFASDYEALEDPQDEIRDCVPETKQQMLREKDLLD